MGHLADHCRKESDAKVKKVWRPKQKAPIVPKKAPKTPIPVTTPKPVSPRSAVVTPSVHVGRASMVTKLMGVQMGVMNKGLLHSLPLGDFLLGCSGMMQVDMLHTTAQCIHTKVKDMMQGFVFYFTLVYGFNKIGERESLWQDLRNYATTANGPWLVGGDFNSVMRMGERIGGTDVTLAEILPMRKALDDCQLQEGKMIGSYFTWNNKQDDGTRFNRTSARKRAPFKYFNMWALADNFDEVVQHGWQEDIDGSPMFRVTKKLKGLKHRLQELNREQFSDIENLTHVTEIALQNFQEQLRHDPLNNEVCKAERACAQELMGLRKAKEMYLAQKAKESWVKDGDSNPSFFHSSIKRRRSMNRVYQISDAAGKMCTTPEDIKVAFEQFYKGLLGTSTEVKHVKPGVIKSGQCLTDEQREMLSAPVTDEEIKAAMFSIPGTKAPGPDGYSSQFFKDSWHIVGSEVCKVVRNAYETGNVLKESNNTILTLIPKVELSVTVL
ncbi:uncharacterized protein LOC141630656 [Silene latifolia]|uniref:uncharacterized protein LOC141630656 n=1 Tax=Silene latifolia TaxID=37657 RepID=UPI003D77A926